jgi:enoyl-CoA hydratase/carnithine racemase
MLKLLDHGALRELRLDRPPANALDPALVAALADAVEAAPGEGARALVLSGSPGRYSGGLDVPHLLGLDRPAMERFLADFFRLMRSLAASRVPIVAAITGHAPAGGAVMAIFCDHRVMAEGDFVIGLNEVRVGLSLPRVIHDALELVVGARQAARLGTLGLLVPASEAFRIGLVDELVAPELVVERALQIAGEHLALPPLATARTRELSRARLVALFDAQQEATFARFVDDWFSEETQTALGALVARLRQKAEHRKGA